MNKDDLDLVDEWRHHRISEDNFQKLQLRLRASAKLRAELRALADLEESLTSKALQTFAIFEEPPIVFKPLPVNRILTILPWFIAAASIFLATLAWAPQWLPIKKQTLPELSHHITAILVDEEGANFSNSKRMGDVSFGPGTYSLESGSIHLRFLNGADLLVQGPAEFEIKNEFHTQLWFGGIRAIVPKTARGFTIMTKDANFEDMGTEFALTVGLENGECAMHVFEGSVNVRNSLDGKLLRNIQEGDWIRYNGGFIENSERVNFSEFPVPGNIGYHRWRNQDKLMMNDPDLMAWFPFNKESNPSLLTNARRDQSVRDGRIVGARWVSGRWPGKQALLFDRDNDYVQVEIPGEHQELSIAVWVKIDSFDNDMNAILNSNGADAGDFHFQITRQGWPRGGIIGVSDSRKNKWLGSPIPLAKWTHLVAVTSIPNKTHQIYVNGKLALEGILTNTQAPIRPGFCMLGNWLPSPEYLDDPPRALRGRIDELQVWKRALDQASIERLLEQGRPNQLWNPQNPPQTLNIVW